MSCWRDAAAYAPLLRLDRFGLAWEWLRRNEHYDREAMAGCGQPSSPHGDPARWGLHYHVDPRLAAPAARPMWRARHCPVLRIACQPGGTDPIDRGHLGGLLTLADGEGIQLGLVSDGWKSLRLDIVEGSLAAGPVTPRYLLSGIGGAEAQLRVLRQFLHVARTGAMDGPLFPSHGRGRRQLLMLRAFDGWRSGASQREIAGELLDGDAGISGWRTELPDVRSRVQRLVRSARWMADAGFHDLLGP